MRITLQLRTGERVRCTGGEFDVPPALLRRWLAWYQEATEAARETQTVPPSVLPIIEAGAALGHWRIVSAVDEGAVGRVY